MELHYRRGASGRVKLTVGIVLLLICALPVFTSFAEQTVDSTESDLSGADENKSSGPYCGLYAVFGALASLDISIDFKSLVEPKYIGSSRGSSIEELKQAAEDHGAHCAILTQLSSASLDSASHPMILHVAGEKQLKEYNHWILFLGMEDGKARVIDPPNPLRLVPVAGLMAIWDGSALVVSDQPIDSQRLITGEYWLILNYIFLAAGVLAIMFLLRSGGSRRNNRPAIERSVQKALASATGQGIMLFVGAGVTAVGLHVAGREGFFNNQSVTSFIAAANIDTFFPKLTLEHAVDYMRHRDVVILDARYQSDYERGHIPGAISIPINSSAVDRQKILAGIGRDRPILVYCQSSSCPFDDTMSVMLARDGYKSVALYTGGWTDWKKSEHYHE